MKHVSIALSIVAGIAAVAVPSAASARPHHHHGGGYGVVSAYGYSPYGYGYSPYTYGSAYGYSPYGYSSYGYSPYSYGLTRHQRHHIRDQIHDQQDHMYGVHNHH